MSEVESVRALYNQKAQDWRRKYDADGPLAYRIAAFASRLHELVAPPAPVLDFGCGTGHLAFYLSGAGYQVAACDIAERMLEEAKQAFPAAHIDWQLLSTTWKRLPFADGSFQGIVSSSVFEYLPDPAFVFAECARVLRPGGVMLVSIPNLSNPVRRVEGLLRTATQPLKRFPAARRLLPMQSYLDYLSLSRNRLPVARWDALARDAGLTPIDARPLGTAVAGAHLRQFPLLLLSYRR